MWLAARGACLVFVVTVSVGVIAGCGGSAAPHASSTAQDFTDCLLRIARPHGVTAIPRVPPGEPSGSPPAAFAVAVSTGGPSQRGSEVIDSPIDTEDIFIFGDRAGARRAAAMAGPAVARAATAAARRARRNGNPDASPGITSVTVVGRAALVYEAGTAFGPGNPLSALELADTRGCLEKSGYA